jgi:hypothetical protein
MTVSQNLSAVGLAIPAALDSSRPMATVESDGSVSVDWSAAEAAAKEPLSGSMFGTIARVMIAIRDGAAKATSSAQSSGKE